MICSFGIAIPSKYGMQYPTWGSSTKSSPMYIGKYAIQTKYRSLDPCFRRGGVV